MKDILKNMDKKVVETYIKWATYPSPFTVLMKVLKDKSKEDKK